MSIQRYITIGRKILQINKFDCDGNDEWIDTCYEEDTLCGEEIGYEWKEEEVSFVCGYIKLDLRYEWGVSDPYNYPSGEDSSTGEFYTSLEQKKGFWKMRIYFKALPLNFYFAFARDVQPSLATQYVVVSNIDKEVNSDSEANNKTRVKYRNETPNTWQKATFEVDDLEEHFVDIAYYRNFNYYPGCKGIVFVQEKSNIVRIVKERKYIKYENGCLEPTEETRERKVIDLEDCVA